MNDIEKIIDAVNRSNARIIAIDGRAASGKSTLSKALSEILYAPVIRMDDFFLPFEKRTKERLSEIGGNIDYERFSEEIIPKLRSEYPFSYKRFDCSAGTMAQNVFIDKSAIKIIEGSYSAHPAFGKYYDLLIFKDVDKDEQLRRLERRNPEKLDDFINKWIVMEEAYFSYYSIKEKADIIL